MPDNIHTSPRQVTTVEPQDTTEIQLRLMDWRRIFRKVKSIVPEKAKRELYAGISWGVTTTAVLTLIPLYNSTDKTDPWVKPTFWLVAIASFIIGLVCWNGIKENAKKVEATRDDLIADMKDIHCLYFPKENLDDDTDA